MMNFWQRITGTRPTQRRELDPNNERLWTTIGGTGQLPGTSLDYVTLAGDLWLTSLVGPILNWAQRNIPQASPTVMKTTRGKDVTDTPVELHPLLDVLERPGRGVSLTALLGATITSLECAGNAFWLVTRGNAGGAIGLQYFPHFAVTPLRGGDGAAAAYRLNTSGGQVTMPAEDVVHFRHGLDPRNDLLGLSPLYPVLREIVGDTETSNWLAGLLRNSAVPGLLVLDKAGALDDNARRAFKATLDDRTKGDRRGSSMVVSGDLGLERMGYAPKELEVAEVRKYFEARVCAAIGLNPTVMAYLVGIENATDNKQEEYHRAAWTEFVLPILGIIAETLTVQLLPQFPQSAGLYVSWDTSGVLALQEDADSVAARSVQLTNAGVVSINEARAMQGLEPLAGDDYEMPIPLTVRGAREWQKSKGVTPDNPEADQEDSAVRMLRSFARGYNAVER